jgi:hypothetical protein
MGTILKSVSADEGTTFFHVRGEVGADQVLNRIISFLTETPTRLAVWDLAGGSLRKVSTKDLEMIIALGKPYTGSRAGGRTAIVCENDRDYGLSRMFEVFARVYEIPFEIRVFWDRHEAQEWLGELPLSTNGDH